MKPFNDMHVSIESWIDLKVIWQSIKYSPVIKITLVAKSLMG